VETKPRMVKITCANENCGKIFDRISSQLKQKERMFCSRDCSNETLYIARRPTMRQEFLREYTTKAWR
jgi:hypothetical protein